MKLIQHLMTLPSPIKERAVANISTKQFQTFVEETWADSTSNALKVAFPWSYSNEGFMYWKRVFDAVTEYENKLEVIHSERNSF